MASGTASGVDENNLAESGHVEQVCRQWIVREDNVMALRLQEKEIESHYGLNRERRRLVRSDLITARVAQTEEEEIARVEFEEIMKQLEEEDERLAIELHEELSRQEEEQLKNMEEADAEFARQLQEKEKKKFQRLQEKKREQEVTHEKELVEETLSQHIQEAKALLGGSLNQSLKDTHLDPPESEDTDFTDFYQPPDPEMTNDEIRQLQELQDERKSQTYRDKQLAIEVQDRELAKVLQAQEKKRAKKLQEKARQKAILEKNGSPEQTGTKSKIIDGKNSPDSSRRHSRLRSKISSESSQELSKLHPCDLTLQSTHSSGSSHSHCSDSTARLSQLETQSHDSSIKNSTCLSRHPETASIGSASSPSHSINIAMVLDPTYNRKRPEEILSMEIPVSSRNSYVLPSIGQPITDLASGAVGGEDGYYDDEDESPAPPYMPIQGQRRTSSLEKGKGKAAKQKNKEGCKTQ